MTVQQMCCLCDLQGPGEIKSIGIRLEGREKKKKVGTSVAASRIAYRIPPGPSAP